MNIADEFSDADQTGRLNVFGIDVDADVYGNYEITAEIAQNSLLSMNYLPALNSRNPEMPPIISTACFTPEISEGLLKYTDSESVRANTGYDYLRYSQTKYDGHRRLTGIPHPYAYAKTVQAITENWDVFGRITSNQNSALRPRLQPSGKIFSYDYEDSVDISFEKLEIHDQTEFIAKFDIQNFYPSIYTHSITWAEVGISQAKFLSATSGLNALASHKLDKSLQLMNRKQSAGVIIGPGTSSVVAEYILLSIDEKLRERFGDQFNRHIDDYRFNATSRAQVDDFRFQLERLLGDFELHLNAAKSTIIGIHEPRDPRWKIKLSAFQLDSSASIQRMEEFWQFALLEYERPGSDQRLLRWAMAKIMRVAVENFNSNWAISFLISQIRAFPYLSPFLKVALIDSFWHDEASLTKLRNTFLAKLDQLYDDSATWQLALLASKSWINNDVVSAVLRTERPILLTILLECNLLDRRALQEIRSNMGSDMFSNQRRWLFEYQCYLRDDSTTKDTLFKYLKSKKVNFIDTSYLPYF